MGDGPDKAQSVIAEIRQWLRWRKRLHAIRWAREHKAAEGMGYYLAYCWAAKDRKPVIARKIRRCRRQMDRLVQLERGKSPWSTMDMPEASERERAFQLMCIGHPELARVPDRLGGSGK